VSWEFLDVGLAWTPDSKWLVVPDSPAEGPSGLFLLSTETGARRRLTSAPGKGAGDCNPAFSPDGRTLAFARQTSSGMSELYLLPLAADLTEQGPPRRLTFGSYLVASPTWGSDVGELLFSQGGWMSERQLWRVATGSGSAGPPDLRPLPVGKDATDVVYSRKSRRLVFSYKRFDTNIYRVPLRGPGGPVGGAERLVFSTRPDHGSAYAPTGDRMAFASTRSGSEEIWVSNADGTSPRQITSMGGAMTSNPRWAPDGLTIVFDSGREGSRDLYLISPQGGAPRRLTDDPDNEMEANWSRDGRWVYFHSGRTGRDEVWKIPANGGAAVQVTRNGGNNASESPDGRWLYYAKGGVDAELWKAPLAGGAEARVLQHLSYAPNYVVTTHGVYFMRATSWLEHHSLAYLDLSTGKVKTLLNASGRLFVGLTISPDDRWVAFSQTDSMGANLIAVDDFE
jgi:Tol biopolymer transport system component